MALFSEIKEDFVNVYRNDPAIHSRVEFLFNYPGVWAIAWYRIAHRFHRAGFKRLARITMGINQFFTNIDIHPAARIGRRVFIDHGIGVVIGETCIIEDDVIIYQGVTLGGVSLTVGKRHPTVRRGAVIGAGSVVTKNVPGDVLVAGNPARVIKNIDNSSE